MQLVLESEIPQPAKMVALVIADAINEHRPGAGCWISIQRISKRSGYSRRTVFGALASLQEGMVIQVANRRGSSNIYQMNVDGVRAYVQAPESDSRAKSSHQPSPVDLEAAEIPVQIAHGLLGITTPQQRRPVHLAHGGSATGTPTRASGAPLPVHLAHRESEVESELTERESEVHKTPIRISETPKPNSQLRQPENTATGEVSIHAKTENRLGRNNPSKPKTEQELEANRNRLMLQVQSLMKQQMDVTPR